MAFLLPSDFVGEYNNQNQIWLCKHTVEGCLVFDLIVGPGSYYICPPVIANVSRCLFRNFQAQGDGKPLV